VVLQERTCRRYRDLRGANLGGLLRVEGRLFRPQQPGRGSDTHPPIEDQAGRGTDVDQADGAGALAALGAVEAVEEVQLVLEALGPHAATVGHGYSR
jgi:hypothetical protein